MIGGGRFERNFVLSRDLKRRAEPFRNCSVTVQMLCEASVEIDG